MADNTFSNLVVRKIDPRRRRMLMAAAGACLLVAAALGFLLGRYSVGYIGEHAERYHKTLTSLQDAYADNARLRERVAALESSEQVARGANGDLREQIGGLQQQLADVKGELSLYKSLAAAGSNGTGLGVHQVLIRPTGAPNVFEYTLTLMQNLEKADVISGTVRIWVEGSLGGEPARLGLERLQANEPDGLDYSFKYFQVLRGSITLPADFEPARILVELDPDRGGESETVKADFDWAGVVKRPSRDPEDGAKSP